MRKNLLREKLRAGQPTLATRITIPDPSVIEALGHTGQFDYVEFIGEYSPFTLHDLDNFARAAEVSELGIIFKVDYELRRFWAQRATGSGFSGALFSDLRTVEDVDYAVRSIRPDSPEHGGAYGAIPRRNARPVYGGSPEYIASLNEQVVGIMVEKPEMVVNLERALDLGGVDFVQWGPNDFHMSSGLDWDDVRAAENRVLKISERAGVPCRAEIPDLTRMPEYLDRGIRHFNITSDLNVIYNRYSELGAEARSQLEGRG